MADGTGDCRSGAEPPRSGAARFTFRGNLRATRHGWLRLTPAYSVHLVRELVLGRGRPDLPVLDPFSGTGTTLLACAEHGIDCDTIDLNPFLVWLARAKVAAYPPRTIDLARDAVAAMARAARAPSPATPWVPPLHRIERWWSADTLSALGHAHAALPRARGNATNLAKLAFCRALIDTASVSFAHQSMSFGARGAARGRAARGAVAEGLLAAFEGLAAGASALPRSRRRVLLGDSRAPARLLGQRRYGAVITSPPYSNRMSYIRELRPYMYWLGYLGDRRDAGELDWRAIGGTWGSATSRLATWKPRGVSPVAGLDGVCRSIARQSPLLATYVERYFHDMNAHVKSLRPLVASGGQLAYVVGNSKFYDVVLPAEQLLARLFEKHGFTGVNVEVLRKRTSKRELYEYLVTGRRR